MIGVLFLVFEMIWVGRMIRRLPKDLANFIHPWDKRDRVADVVLWTITLLFMFHLGFFAWQLARPTLKFFYPNL